MYQVLILFAVFAIAPVLLGIYVWKYLRNLRQVGEIPRSFAVPMTYIYGSVIVTFLLALTTYQINITAVVVILILGLIPVFAAWVVWHSWPTHTYLFWRTYIAATLYGLVASLSYLGGIIIGILVFSNTLDSLSSRESEYEIYYTNILLIWLWLGMLYGAVKVRHEPNS